MGNVPLREPCRSCGRVGVTHQGRGLCSACYHRQLRAGTLGHYPPVGPPPPRPPMPEDGDARRAYLAAADAWLRRDIRARLAAGTSLVTAHDWTRLWQAPETCPIAAD